MSKLITKQAQAQKKKREEEKITKVYERRKWKPISLDPLAHIKAVRLIMVLDELARRERENRIM